jgi:uncharacterized membrane protein
MIKNKEPIRWIFKKNCSFTPKQVGLFYLAQATFSLLVAGFFLWQGIWVVLPFTFIELIVLAILLLLYAKHATDYEEILLEDGLFVLKMSNGYRVTEFAASASWLQLSNQLTPKKMIGVYYQGKLKEFGKFIHLHKREDFRKELESYLISA